MGRKKSDTVVDASVPTTPKPKKTAQTTTPLPASASDAAQASVQQPMGADSVRQPSAITVAADGSARTEAEKTWGNPYRATFTCPAKGFELGENYRFRQVVFYFKESPDMETKTKLKDAGFVYRAGEKGWTLPATAANREVATNLARVFKGEQVSNGR